VVRLAAADQKAMAITKQPILVMIQGPEPGSFYKLPDNRVVSIGRSSRNTIRAVSRSVSRFHCEVAWVNGRWELTDLNSKKGTLVNGELIEGRCELFPGDIVRVSTTVFRFDMIDETSLNDSAMVAIMEAELNQRLSLKGEASVSLDEIRARSRLESKEIQQRRRDKQRVLKVNVAFLGVFVAMVGVAVTGVLLFAHRRATINSPSGAVTQARAKAALESALAARDSGNRSGAMAQLEDLIEQFPAAEAALPAQRELRELQWTQAEEALRAVGPLESRGEYSRALAIYDRINTRADRALEDFVRNRREFTVRLAYASYRATERAARQHLAQGEAAAALEGYRQAAQRLGVPELVQKARDAIAEINGAVSG
jgi:pSer/pThr/pTyr-binding forkhead associated (FHA) protein